MRRVSQLDGIRMGYLPTLAGLHGPRSTWGQILRLSGNKSSKRLTLLPILVHTHMLVRSWQQDVVICRRITWRHRLENWRWPDVSSRSPFLGNNGGGQRRDPRRHSPESRSASSVLPTRDTISETSRDPRGQEFPEIKVTTKPRHSKRTITYCPHDEILSKRGPG